METIKEYSKRGEVRSDKLLNRAYPPAKMKGDEGKGACAEPVTLAIVAAG
jgi:hypothetical protein